MSAVPAHPHALSSGSATTVNLIPGQVIEYVWGEEVIIHTQFVVTSFIFFVSSDTAA